MYFGNRNADVIASAAFADAENQQWMEIQVVKLITDITIEF